jgi:hypothetical protein
MLFTIETMTAFDSILNMVHGDGATSDAVQTAGCRALKSLCNSLKLPSHVLDRIYETGATTFGDVCHLMLEAEFDQRLEAELKVELSLEDLQTDLDEVGADAVGSFHDDEATFEAQFDDSDFDRVSRRIYHHFGVIPDRTESGLCSWSVGLPYFTESQRETARRW